MTQVEIKTKLIELGLTNEQIDECIDLDYLVEENYTIEDLKEIVSDVKFISKRV